MCSCCSSCLDLLLALVDFEMKGCDSRLHHICQGMYVDMHEIDLDGAELRICCECVYKLCMGGKPDKLKKVQHSIVYRTDESEEDEEELERKVLGGVGEDVSIVPVVYPCGTVSVSSLGYFSSVGFSSKPSHPSLPVSVGARHIQEHLKNERVRKLKFIKPQQEKARHEEQMKRGKVVVRAKLVVGYWELIPMESGAELLAPQDTATVRVAEERQAAKKQRNYWWT